MEKTVDDPVAAPTNSSMGMLVFGTLALMPGIGFILSAGATWFLAKRLGLERQWLHARSLAFAHPADGRRIEITSPYPADLQHALDVLRTDS